MSGIRKKNKSPPKKFWNHLKALGTTKEVHTRIQDGDGICFCRGQCFRVPSKGIDLEFIQLLKAIYEDNKVHITWEGRRGTEPVYIQKGLKQGCPLLPLMFRKSGSQQALAPGLSSPSTPQLGIGMSLWR